MNNHNFGFCTPSRLCIVAKARFGPLVRVPKGGIGASGTMLNPLQKAVVAFRSEGGRFDIFATNGKLHLKNDLRRNSVENCIFRDPITLISTSPSQVAQAEARKFRYPVLSMFRSKAASPTPQPRRGRGRILPRQAVGHLENTMGIWSIPLQSRSGGLRIRLVFAKFMTATNDQPPAWI